MGQENSLPENIVVTFSADELEAYVSIANDSKEYTREDIIKFLATAGVKEGISPSAIDKMLEDNKPGQQCLVAVGQKPVSGEDGWFEFLFDTEIDNKPRILKDGSVDYSAYGNVPTVVEGQKVAIYHPAIECQDGITCKGETIVAKKGKELAKLKGKGFTISENGTEYFARNDGRVTYQDSRLIVESELLVEGDVSYSTGDITFQNDIHICGNVLTGVTIRSEKGSIIVDGYVEACEMYAAKDVVLKNGMQGNGRGKIVAGGTVSGKFFEQSSVEAGGNVCANAIMNSNVEARQDIEVSGRFGIIIGGYLHAERYVIATIIGNMAEVKTEVFAGSEENLFAKLLALEKEQEKMDEELKKVVQGISQIERLIDKGDRDDLNQQKIKLIRAKVEKEAQISEKVRTKQEVMDQMSRANVAKIKVQKAVYPGTRVNINGVKKTIREEAHNVQIVSKGSMIEMA